MPGGRPPKYPQINLKKVQELAGYGLIDKEIASILDICLSTLKNYKNEHAEFLAAISAGKLRANTKVVKSLFKRAVGYKYREVHKKYEMDETGKKTLKKVEEILQRVAPDSKAATIWLYNRDPDRWKRKVEIGGGNEPIKVVVEVEQPKGKKGKEKMSTGK